MLTGLVLAAVCLGYLPPLQGVAIAVINVHPWSAVPVVALAVVRSRKLADRTSVPEMAAALLRSIAAELMSGRSLRMALVDSARHERRLDLERVMRLAAAGRPMERVAEELAACRGLSAAAIAVRVAAMTGGSAVPVFGSLAADAADEAALQRERRELTVQARLSIAVVAGFPIAVLSYQVVSGRALDLIRQGPVGVGLLLSGVTLLSLGLAVVAVLMRRVRV